MNVPLHAPDKLISPIKPASVQSLQQSAKTPEQQEKEVEVSNNLKDTDPRRLTKPFCKRNLVNLEPDAKPMDPVIDVLSKDFNPNPTVFKIRTRNNKTITPPTPKVLVNKY